MMYFVLPLQHRLRRLPLLAFLALVTQSTVAELAEAPVTGSDFVFDFGNNWLNFIRKSQTPGDVSWATRVQIAKESLLASLGVRSLAHVSVFLDVGCGSGIHSLSALRAGAKRVVSFDLQKGSIEAARLLWEQEGRPENWLILQGSVLDSDFLETLPRADLVFAWGSLHHTGDVRQAVLNVARLLDPGGLLHMALYSIEFEPDADFWDGQKQNYVTFQREGGGVHQSAELMVHAYVFWQVRESLEWRLKGAAGQLGRRLTSTEEFQLITKELSRLNSEHALSRGMDLWTDARDGLGGWPNERLEAIAVVELAKNIGLEAGLEMVSVDARMDGGPTGFNLLRTGGQRSASTLWREAGLRLQNVCGPYSASKWVEVEDNVSDDEVMPRTCWLMSIPGFETAVEGSDEAPLRLLEDGHFLGLSSGRHHKDKRFCRARGRYSHETFGILFMTSDYSDPNTNGRAYQVLVPDAWPALEQCIG